MSIASASSSKTAQFRLGPRSAGMLLTPVEFDRAHSEEGWRYELIHGVLVVSPTPSCQERDSNERLANWLIRYQSIHPQGRALDLTLYEEEIETRGGQDRRRLDRAIWAGLGRLPEKGEIPKIAVEFVSEGKVNQERDYIVKRAEYREAGIRAYWVIDRFQRTLTSYGFSSDSDDVQVFAKGQAFQSPLLPGFVLDLKELFSYADRWSEKKRRGD